MHRVSSFFPPAALLLASLASVNCSGAAVVVEVLPPRTSITCAAPGKADAALGRGLLDVRASAEAHGSYVADLRLSTKGIDAHIDGVTVAYTLPDGVNGDVDDAADDAAGDLVVGDVLLAGEGDDARVAVVENVELVPRALSKALLADGDLGLSQIEFATLGITITPIIGGVVDETITGSSTTFALDLCEGCLVQPPESCNADGDNAFNPSVCRPGQDTPSFACVQAAPGAP